MVIDNLFSLLLLLSMRTLLWPCRDPTGLPGFSAAVIFLTYCFDMVAGGQLSQDSYIAPEFLRG